MKVSALADRLDTGSGPVEILQGPFANGERNTGKHTIERRDEMLWAGTRLGFSQ